MALLSWNGVKYEFLTGEDVLPVRRLIEKDFTIQTFENSSWGK